MIGEGLNNISFDNLSDVEIQTVLKIVSRLREGDSSLLEQLNDDELEGNKIGVFEFAEEPVDIETFICDTEYLGKSTDRGRALYDFWHEKLSEIFSDANRHIIEVILTGPTGIGKSTIAQIGILYQYYCLMCLTSPQSALGMLANHDITFLIFSLTADLSESTNWSGIQKFILESDWFLERGAIRGDKIKWYENKKGIIFGMGGSYTPGWGVISKNIYASLFDEMSEIKFSSRANLELEQTKAFKIYLTQLGRSINRFVQNKELPGKNWLVSSKQDKLAFLEKYVQKVKNEEQTLVIDEPAWKIKPKQYFSGATFKVALGDPYTDPFVVDGLNAPKAERFECIDVPIEFKRLFTLDIRTALRDIAGVSLDFNRRSKLFPDEKDFINCCVEGRQNPINGSEIELGFNDDSEIIQYIDLEKLLALINGREIFIHFDMAVTEDRLGVGVVAPCQLQGDEWSDEELDEDDLDDDFSGLDYVANLTGGWGSLEVDQILAFGIVPTPGDHIPFFKLRRFINQLSKFVSTMTISADGHQSEDMIQLLTRKGFDASLVSVDKTDIPYTMLKNAILEKRFHGIYVDLLNSELIQLERDFQTKKVDHPDGGSKDVADGICGAYYKCIVTQSKPTRIGLHIL